MGKKRTKDTVLDEFYEVDHIKARRIVKGGGVEYLIHWKDYDASHDSWEPLSNLAGMENDLSVFEAKEKKDAAEFAAQKAAKKAQAVAKAAVDKAIPQQQRRWETSWRNTSRCLLRQTWTSTC